jgi:hypothetical protein
MGTGPAASTLLAVCAHCRPTGGSFDAHLSPTLSPGKSEEALWFAVRFLAR